MKYKVGDKVKVRSDLKRYEIYGGYTLIKSMEKFVGKTVTISHVGIHSYKIEESEDAYWTDKMFEGLAEDELTAKEAIRLQGEICVNNMCSCCPIGKARRGIASVSCDKFREEYPEKALEAIKQWKEDHEKKPIETEFIYIVRIIENKQCVHEEEIDGESEDEAQERVLKKYCEDHEGKFYAVVERICRVKE